MISHSGLPADILEMLVGHLSDLLSPARDLITQLRLKSNASVTTRGELEHLNDGAGSNWERLARLYPRRNPLQKEIRTRA
jgi:hypothetical protein